MKREWSKGIPGFALLELLMAIFIFGIIVLSLQRVLMTALSSSTGVNATEDVLMDARRAMERMTIFVQESDQIANPATATEGTLKVTERVIDTHNNTTHAYVAAGDGLPDADRNSDGMINQNDGSVRDYITYFLDQSNSTDWKLVEQAPDYGGAAGATLPNSTICEHVTQFQCTRLSSNLVTILLTVSTGKTTVTLQTRARARLIE